MSELNIKVRKSQDNGSTFRATPDTLYMGGVGSAKVDTLHFEVPEEWAGCAITLHVQRLSGALPDPQMLDENNCVVVDRRWTQEKQGSWMLLAVDENGYIAMTKPGKYTCYETIDTNSTTETITPSVYEQFVALVKKWGQAAVDAARAAKESEERAAGSASASAGSAAAAARSESAAAGSATAAAGSASAAEQAKAAAATSEANAKDSEDAAKAAAEEAAASKAAAATSEKKADASKTAAAQSEANAEVYKEAAATSESNAAGSASASAGSAAAAARSESAAAGSSTQAANSANAAEKSKTAAATSEINAARHEEAAKEVVTQNAKGYGGGYSRTFTLTAPQTGWAVLEAPIGIYRYYADVALADCTAKWNAFAAVLPESAMTAFVARVANIVETKDGSVRLYAVNAPEQDVKFILSVFAVGSRTYSLTVPANGWVQAENTVGVNQWQCDLTLEDSSVEKVPMGMAALENTTEALSTPGLSATMETFDGYIRVYAKKRPAVDINIVVILLAKNEVN